MKDTKIYFLGIGGVSMSALAVLSTHLGAKVFGSDDNKNFDFTNLQKNGIECENNINREFLDSCDILVFTIAVGQNHPAILYAKSKNKKVFERAEFLGEIAKNFGHTIGVSGTHGKTTTTAMLTKIFSVAGKKPTMHLGGKSLDFKGNLLLLERNYFITEICEFNKSLLKISPESCIINNIECDHMDTYKDLKDIQDTFVEFAEKTQKLVVINGDEIDKNLFLNNKNIVTFGLNIDNDFYAKNLRQSSGKFSFECYKKGVYLGEINLNILGKHNVKNALGCVALASEYDIGFDSIKKGLESFLGVERRLNLLGEQNGVKIYHDYAHHPTEIKATLDTLRLLKPNKIIAVFQPHTYTRTKAFLKEFCESFLGLDYLFILPTFSAREQYIMGGDAMDIFYQMNGKIDCAYCTNFETLNYELDKILSKNDILVWLGAGDIFDTANQFLSAFKNIKNN